MKINCNINIKGIIRDESCQRIDSWNADQCSNLDHQMIIFESLDSDSADRRISPVGLRSDTGYIDLINGPSSHKGDHGYSSVSKIPLKFSTFNFNLPGSSSVPIPHDHRSRPPVRAGLYRFNATDGTNPQSSWWAKRCHITVGIHWTSSTYRSVQEEHASEAKQCIY